MSLLLHIFSEGKTWIQTSLRVLAIEKQSVSDFTTAVCNQVAMGEP
jgi:hypothetical protein